MSTEFAYVTAGMLVWARGETPFQSAADAVSHLRDISEEELTSWEHGSALPSLKQARELAELYQVPFSCFYLNAPPAKQPVPYQDKRTRMGTASQEISYELWKEIHEIRTRRNCLLNLELPGSAGVCALPHFREEDSPDTIGDGLRSFLGIQLPFNPKACRGDAWNYCRNLLEDRNILVFQMGNVDPVEMSGLSIACDRFPIVAVNGRDSKQAKVFSLFHELAHLARRSSSLCRIGFDDPDDGEENLCNQIAASILMPADLFDLCELDSPGAPNLCRAFIDRQSPQVAVRTPADWQEPA